MREKGTGHGKRAEIKYRDDVCYQNNNKIHTRNNSAMFDIILR